MAARGSGEPAAGGGLTTGSRPSKLTIVMSSELLRDTSCSPTDPTTRARRLQQSGLKVTGPRLAILDVLEQNASHPTADQLYAMLRPAHPSLSLSTVYKTLDAFAQVGLCRRLNGEGPMQRFDGTMYPHHHAVCRGCGHIYDVPANTYPGPSPPARLPGQLAVCGVRVEFEVICPACAEERALR